MHWVDPPPFQKDQSMAKRQAIVKWFDQVRGFGFITPNNPDEPDLFVHAVGLVPPLVYLVGGELVEYDIGTSRKTGRPMAVGVKVKD